CFDAVYRSNSYGARDKDRQKESLGSRRVIVLGDSMIEGFGVDAADRVTDRLERATGIEHLNFGTSGDFGSIQEWLLYTRVKKDFDHSEVMLFMLPDNDF